MATMCDKCGAELHIGDFPFCGGDASKHQPYGGHVVGDECDVTVRHGLCHENGEPRRFRSKAEMAKVAAAKGLTNYVRHVGSKGSDKSAHTQRFV
jgi:hypothetical protein